MKIVAYFDIFSGISGDMTLGAFVDLGVPIDWLVEKLNGLPIEKFDLVASPAERHGISATNLQVVAGDSNTFRNFADILTIIGESDLPERTRAISADIFRTLAMAESKIHGCPPDHVHFHEVGAIDSIIDIVGTALCIEYLEIESFFASRIPVGTGFTTCEHGILPVPVPATVEILKGLPVYGTDTPVEMVTPTGAAIVATLCDRFGPMPELVIEKIGYGAGDRQLDSRPNLLRVFLGKSISDEADTADDLRHEQILIVETCIDDMNPEIFGYLMERLLQDGALDVYWIPVYMKKNRPGTMVQVLCRDHQKDAVARRILSETTSLGVRFYKVGRLALQRDAVTVNSRFGKIRMKRVRGVNGNVRLIPEFEECRRVALENGMPLNEVYTIIRGEQYLDKINGDRIETSDEFK